MRSAPALKHRRIVGKGWERKCEAYTSAVRVVSLRQRAGAQKRSERSGRQRRAQMNVTPSASTGDRRTAHRATRSTCPAHLIKSKRSVPNPYPIATIACQSTPKSNPTQSIPKEKEKKSTRTGQARLAHLPSPPIQVVALLADPVAGLLFAAHEIKIKKNRKSACIPRGQRKAECKQSGSQRAPGTQHPAPPQARAAGAAEADDAGALGRTRPASQLPPQSTTETEREKKKTTHMRDRPAVAGV